MLALDFMMSLRFGAVVFLMVSFVSNVASAQFSFVSQDRSIYYHRIGELVTSLSDPEPFEEEAETSAPDFEPFEALLSAYWIVVRQSSRLGPLNISASGAVDIDAVDGPAFPVYYYRGEADGYSSLQVEFVLDRPTPYQISARSDTASTPIAEGWAWVRLRGPGGVSIFDVSDYPLPMEQCAFDHGWYADCAEGGASGVLQPGHYILEAHAEGYGATASWVGSSWDGYADATYTVTLALPINVPALSGRSAGLLGLALLASGVFASSRIKRGRC